MKRPNLRIIRGGLAALVAATLGIVAWSLRARPAQPGATTPASETPAPGVARMGGFVIRKLDKDGQERFVLNADSMVGQEQEDVQLRGVTMSFPYMADGQRRKAQVTAERCAYTPAIQRAIFNGHVVVTTDDGLELKTESLVYRGDKGLARTDTAMEFKRNELSGSGTGAVYDAEKGTLELQADAFLRIEDEKGGPPMEIHGRQATMNRAEGTLQFVDDVDAKQGADTLKTDNLLITFSTEDRSLVGFSAVGSVQLHLVGGTAVPGLPQAAAKGHGTRDLKAQRLEVGMHKDRSLEQATAGPDAELTILPGPGEVRSRRLLKARFLTFHFDEKGRLQEVDGQKDALMREEALPPAKAEPREVSCRNFTSRLDPESGDVTNVEFHNEVVMTRGTQRSGSENAFYDGAKKLLTFEGDPELKDSADGSRLSAQRIEVNTDTRDVNAYKDVRHLLGAQGARRKPGMLSSRPGDEPTLVSCGQFSHEEKTRTTRYLEGAVLRSGKDEVRSPTMRVIEDAAGKRRLAATEGVVSVFHPQESSAKPTPGKAAPAPLETRSKQMTYEEAAGKIVYNEDVVMRQADIVSKSPEATVTLTPDGNQVQTVVAGEPVEIEQGVRKANGRQATYTPTEETVVVVGEKVVLKDPTQEVQGRSLTFHVHDDRILVDGREEVRTETILKKEPSKP
jgi:lipopolysaccharide export system protein LptA